MDATTQDTKPLRRVGRPPKVDTKEPNVLVGNAAQAYAERVWCGQSDDLPVSDRLDRVRAALVGQNMDCAGVTLDGNKL